MKRAILIIGMGMVLAATWAAQREGGRRAPVSSPPLAKTESEKKILAVLDEMVETKKLYLSVPAADGRMLRVLAESVGAKHVVEIGTSTGYSGLWFSLALHQNGGQLTTFEMDAGRAATAREHFKKAGVDRIVTVVEGDAHENVKRLKDPIDVAFIDADKEGYVDYLNKLLPLVRPGGLILAHNVNMPAVVEGYIKQVVANPDLETVFFMDGGGLSITLKKR